MKYRSFRVLSALALFTVVSGLTGCGQSGSLTAPESPMFAGLNPATDGGEIPENPRLRRATRVRVSAMSAGDVARVADRVSYSQPVPNVDPNGSLADAVTYTNWRSGFFAWIESPSGARMSQVTTDFPSAIVYVTSYPVAYPVKLGLGDVQRAAGCVLGVDDGSLTWAIKASNFMKAPDQELRKLGNYLKYATCGGSPIA